MKTSLANALELLSTHRFKVIAAGVGVALFAVGIAVAANLSSRAGDATPSASPSPVPTEQASPAPQPSPSPSAEALGLRPGEIVATLAAEQLPVYAEPGDSQPTRRLEKWTTALSLVTVIAIDSTQIGDETWLNVKLPIQPNGSTGWIRESDVTISSTTVQIHIYLDERELDLTDGDELILSHEVAIGTEATPTPPGIYSVTDRLEYPNPDHAYGAYALGLSGFSEVLDTFQGAPPQLAIHGTNQPELIGDRVSNGCIRLPNDVVLAVAQYAQLGTPVIIHQSRAESN